MRVLSFSLSFSVLCTSINTAPGAKLLNCDQNFRLFACLSLSQEIRSFAENEKVMADKAEAAVALELPVHQEMEMAVAAGTVDPQVSVSCTEVRLLSLLSVAISQLSSECAQQEHPTCCLP